MRERKPRIVVESGQIRLESVLHPMAVTIFVHDRDGAIYFELSVDGGSFRPSHLEPKTSEVHIAYPVEPSTDSEPQP